jgi:thiosulfate dehydrogenase [quinone] large subunit
MAATSVVDIEEPRFATWLFGSSRTAWFWLVARLWLGWEWFGSGWGKVFGGSITWKFWNWGDAAYSLTGKANIGWIKAGTVVAADGTQSTLGVGDRIAGFAAGAISSAQGPHPDVAYSWYVKFLEFVRDSLHPVLGYVVSLGELLIGLALILGAFTGVVAFLGALLNFSYMFAGSSGVNPGMVLVSLFVVLAWRNAGWYGLDRFLLPKLGVPWKWRQSTG